MNDLTPRKGSSAVPSNRTCSIDGCEREHDARGWCKTHHARWRRHGDPSSGIAVALPLPPRERFWAKVDTSNKDGCWTWTAVRHHFGYGLFWDGTRQVVAHRYAYEAAYGPIPDGLFALHRCDNPPCVRHDHLFLGTKADNTHDMIAKGRRTPTVGKRGESNHNAIFTRAQAIDIIRRRNSGETQASIARSFGVNHQTISAIVRGQSWPELAEYRS